MSNIHRVLALILRNSQGLDDDEISKKTDIVPRQQVQQLCSRLVEQGKIERRSVEKDGKRKKIHNFPVGTAAVAAEGARTNAPRPATASWERRLAKIEAATSLSRDEILDRALTDFARKTLRGDLPDGG